MAERKKDVRRKGWRRKKKENHFETARLLFFPFKTINFLRTNASVGLFVGLTICVFVHLSICPFDHLTICPYICLFMINSTGRIIYHLSFDWICFFYYFEIEIIIFLQSVTVFDLKKMFSMQRKALNWHSINNRCVIDFLTFFIL